MICECCTTVKGRSKLVRYWSAASYLRPGPGPQPPVTSCLSAIIRQPSAVSSEAEVEHPYLPLRDEFFAARTDVLGYLQSLLTQMQMQAQAGGREAEAEAEVEAEAGSGESRAGVRSGDRVLKVLEVGPGGPGRRFTPATHVVDHFSSQADFPGVQTYLLDLDRQRIPAAEDEFDFVYARHFVEDANNPVGAFEEMARVSRRGYIETPSPMMEALYFQVSPSHTSTHFRGYVHHRFLVYANASDNTLYVIPKFPTINHPGLDWGVQAEWVSLLTSYPHFYNT
ncbi:hypothetical protein B484DRAFT_397379 [Ochromonadaceae sp. CCMP2298]|nr:hypothetical protein B484DRAFT_397379 [Ochromonadaceae sp. CCMP2298]